MPGRIAPAASDRRHRLCGCVSISVLRSYWEVHRSRLGCCLAAHPPTGLHPFQVDIGVLRSMERGEEIIQTEEVNREKRKVRIRDSRPPVSL